MYIMWVYSVYPQNVHTVYYTPCSWKVNIDNTLVQNTLCGYGYTLHLTHAFCGYTLVLKKQNIDNTLCTEPISFVHLAPG